MLEDLVGNKIFLILISVILGAFVGLRREIELQKKTTTGFRGLRTTALVAVFGTISTFFEEMKYLPAIFFSFLALYIFVVYRNGVKKGKIGLTSELSLLIVFWSGVLIGYGEILVGIILSLLISISDAYKDKMHFFAKTLTPEEWTGALQMLLISAPAFLFLPDTPIDPWGVIVPKQIWTLVVILTGLGFIGYFLNKYFKSDKLKGVYLTSFLGSLISSTAVTINLSENIRKKRISETAFLASLVLAIGVMQIRDLVLIFSISSVRKWEIFAPSIFMILSSLILFGYYFWKDKKNTDKIDLKLNPEKNGSPFEILPSLMIALVFSLILLGIYFLKKYLGDGAVYLGSFAVALVDTESLILPSLESLRTGVFNFNTVLNIVVIALVVNTFVKLFYILTLGNKKAFLKAFVPVTIISLSGLLIYFI